MAWVASYSYLYLAAAFLGVTAAADLNAARLLLMPVALLTVAWGRVARPVITRWQAEGRERDLTRIFPRTAWNKLHLQIIYFGRSHCQALRHDLTQCPICGWAATKARVAEEARMNAKLGTRKKKA